MRRPDPPAGDPVAVSVFLVLTSSGAANLVGAVVSYQRQRKVDGLGLDVELSDLVTALAGARPGPRGTLVDGDAETGDSDGQVLLTYGQTAARLAISERHVKRLIAAGRLRRVRLGAASRVHVSDLTAYTDTLRNETS